MIAQKDITKAARLAKIKFSDSEVEKYTAQLSNIMRMIEELQEVDTDGVKPLASVHDASARLREDVVTECDLGDSLFVNAPGKDASFAQEIKCFIVPKVVE
jgi:aspartyl-tRNA(Asn)/glutamyl-tRNA(Gln) amidotransferase subunit C